MADKKYIWNGPGSLRPGKGSKIKQALVPGDEIPVRFIDDVRKGQLAKKGKIILAGDYVKNMASAGTIPVENAASKIKALEAENEELRAENEKLKAELSKKESIPDPDPDKGGKK